MNRVGGRKVMLTLIMSLVGIALVYFKGDIPSGLLTLMQTIFSAFVIGNAFEHMSNSRRPKESPSKTDVSADLLYISNKMDKMEEQLAQSNASLTTLQQAVAVIIDKAGLNK